MKFWKILSNWIGETLPDWQEKFLSYKDLKKQLKLIFPKDGEGGGGGGDDRPIKRRRIDGGDAAEEAAVTDFVELLEKEIAKFNAFFEDKEEEYVMRLKFLQERVAEANDSNEELMKLGREIVDFHGEMVLLENYSSLNYTGLVKILKKYDKLSGALIRIPFIQKVLKQPFFETNILNNLVKECEGILGRLFSQNDQLTPPSVAPENAPANIEQVLRVPEELAEIEIMENLYVKQTLSAIRLLKEIRSGSSTVSAFSLPPLENNELEAF